MKRRSCRVGVGVWDRVRIRVRIKIGVRVKVRVRVGVRIRDGRTLPYRRVPPRRKRCSVG